MAPDLSPLLWLSTLSEHTRQLAAEPRCALLWIDFASGDLLHLEARAELVWPEDYPEPAPPGADMNGFELLRRSIDEGAQALLLPQRADAAHQIAGGPLRGHGVGHFHLLRPGSLGQCLQIQRAGHRHHGHHQLVALRAGE